jgi:iron complex transport system substrate-binding protein
MRLSRRGFVRLAGAGLAAGAAPLTASGPARAAAGRMISVGGVVTEIVFALGAGDRLIAVDSTSYYPPQARSLPDVGYMRQLTAEPIVALAPSLVLLLEESGPPTTVDQLRAAQVPLLHVPDDPSVGGITEKIGVVAGAIGREAEGDALSRTVEVDLAVLKSVIDGVPERPRVLFILAVSNGRLLAAGSNTSAAGIIELAGGRNAVEGYEGYKMLSAEAAVGAAPDLLLFMDRTLDELGGVAGIDTRPELKLTPAAQAGRIKAMDGLLLLGFGPRTPQAVRELAAAIHPTIAFPKA